MATASEEARTNQQAGTREVETRGTEPTQRPLQHRWTPVGSRKAKSTGLRTGRLPEPTGATRSVHESWRAGTEDTQHSGWTDARIDRSTGATGTMMNGECRTNSFRWERPIMGQQAIAIFSTRKRRLEKPWSGPRMISKADRDSTPKASWHKARDREETDRMSETITGWERGGGWGNRPYQNGPHPGFGSKSLLAPEGAERQTPPATEAEPCQEDFNLAPWRKPLERPKPPEATKKGAWPLWPTLNRPVRAEEEERAVDAWECDWGTTVEVPLRSAEEADKDSG